MSAHPPSTGHPGPSATGPPPHEAAEHRVLFAATGERTTATVGLAADLAGAAGGELFVLLPGTVPHPTPLPVPEAADAHTELEDRLGSLSSKRVDRATVHGLVRVGRSSARTVRNTLETYDIQTLVVEDRARGSPLETLRRCGIPAAGCDVVAVTRIDDLRTLASILVPVGGGPHSGLAVDVARAIAVRNGAWIDLLHVVDEDPTEAALAEGRALLEAGLDRLDGFEDADTWLAEAAEVSEGIVEQTDYYDLTVIGAPRRGRLKEFIFGSTTENVRSDASGAVVTVQRDTEDGSRLDRWLSR